MGSNFIQDKSILFSEVGIYQKVYINKPTNEPTVISHNKPTSNRQGSIEHLSIAIINLFECIYLGSYF